MVIHVAGGTEHLHGVGGHPHRGFRGHPLDHGGKRRDGVQGRALVDLPDAFVEQAASRLQTGRHVGEHPPQALIFDQGMPPLIPLLRVVAGVAERGLGPTHGDRANRRAHEMQRPHRRPEAVPLVAEHVLGRDPQVVEEHLDVGDAAAAHLDVVPALDETGAVRLHQECADATATTPSGHRLAGTGEDQRVAGRLAVADPRLLPGDDPGAAVSAGPGRHHRRVRAGPGLAEADTGDGALGQLGQESLLLLTAAVGQQRVGDDPILSGELGQRHRPALGDRLPGHAYRGQIGARATETLRDHQLDQAQVDEPFDDFRRELVLPIDVGRDRRDLPSAERQHRAPERLVLRRQPHHPPPIPVGL